MWDIVGRNHPEKLQKYQTLLKENQPTVKTFKFTNRKRISF